ncbi:type II secretion system F family protein [Flexivirga caeni]|uniref:type II secretion system F family protein n=1 Tax=Flexivirga caeni TaxID=2294115 RepID=UPI001315AA7E|nr:type II secretion system F family protein [Flexivirga caeni]
MSLLVAAAVCLAILLWPGRRSGDLHRLARGPALSLRAAPGRVLRRRAGRSADLDVVVGMLEGIAPALAVGVTPATAVSTSASLAAVRVTRPGLRHDLLRLAREAQEGGELAPCWAQLYARHRIPGLDDVARAWALSEQLGCPIGDALRTATAMMREQSDLDRRIAAATAGPRATMQLLTALPVLGVAIAALIGVPPWRLYAGSLGAFVLIVGALFVVAGRLLTRRMIRRAAAPAGLP